MAACIAVSQLIVTVGIVRFVWTAAQALLLLTLFAVIFITQRLNIKSVNESPALTSLIESLLISIRRFVIAFEANNNTSDTKSAEQETNTHNE